MVEKKWHSQARDLYFNKKKTLTEVAELIGFSSTTVRKFLREEETRLGISGGRETHHFTYKNRMPISKKHREIGVRIQRYRENRPEKLSPTELGEQLGASRKRIRAMELGFHDFTLTELLKISLMIKIPIGELLL